MAAANATRPILPVNGGVRQVNVLMNLGVADYDGLQTQISYRGNRRMYAAVSYTLSKATNTTEPDGNGIGPNESNIARLGEVERGPSLLDQRHRAVITFSYQFPFNITAGTVTQLASARPFNATTGVDNNGDGANNDRPVINGKVISKSAFRGTADLRRGSLRRGPHQAVGTHERPAPAGGLQSLQSRELPRPRADGLRRHRHAEPDVRPAGRRRHGHERDPGVRQHRPAADVPAAGAVRLLGKHLLGKHRLLCADRCDNLGTQTVPGVSP